MNEPRITMGIGTLVGALLVMCAGMALAAALSFSAGTEAGAEEYSRRFPFDRITMDIDNRYLYDCNLRIEE